MSVDLLGEINSRSVNPDRRMQKTASVRALLAMLIASGALLLQSCNPATEDLILASGDPLSRFASDIDTTLVLVYDPADCLSCYSAFSKWFAYKQAHPERVYLVLSREPTDAERKQFVAARIVIDGVLSKTTSIGQDLLPREILYIEGERRRTDDRVRNTSPIYYLLHDSS